MNYRSFWLYPFLLCIFSTIALAEEIVEKEVPAYTIKEFPGVNLTEMTLQNGLKVILKPTDDDSDMTINMSAIGGFTSLKPEERASGEIAGCVVIESGMGDLSADHLATLLYDHSIEFNLKINAFTRDIDATLPPDSVDVFCSIVQKIFIDPKFEEKAFNTVITERKKLLAQKENHTNQNFFIDLMPTKIQHFLAPIKLNDLEKADLKKCHRFFRQAFANPADFVCVIAGDFDKEIVKKAIVNCLGAIPSKNVRKKFVLADSSHSKVVGVKVQQLAGNTESLVKLAFPLQHSLDCTTLEHLELFCQVEENRLNNLPKKPGHEVRGMDVWYEMPLYPSLDNPWLTIQFHVNNTHIQETIDQVLAELKKMHKQGLSQEEVDLAAEMQRQSLQLWQHDNGFWSVLLANSYLWGWDPQEIEKKFSSQPTVKAEAVSNTVRQSMPIHEYKLSFRPAFI